MPLWILHYLPSQPNFFKVLSLCCLTSSFPFAPQISAICFPTTVLYKSIPYRDYQGSSYQMEELLFGFIFHALTFVFDTVDHSFFLTFFFYFSFYHIILSAFLVLSGSLSSITLLWGTFFLMFSRVYASFFLLSYPLYIQGFWYHLHVFDSRPLLEFETRISSCPWENSTSRPYKAQAGNGA